MAEEILLDYVLDQPNVPTSNLETQLKALLKIRVSPTLDEAATAGTHICLVLDVSSSMRDQEMRELRAAAKRAVDMVRPGDVLSLIAFQTVVREVIESERIDEHTDRAAIKRKIDMIEHYRGGGTNMEDALVAAQGQFNVVNDSRLTNKVLLLTDGRVDGVEDKTLRIAAEISGRGTVIDGLGFGPEFDYKFMQRLVSPSNGFTSKIDRPEDITRVFEERVKSATNTLANNVRLKLTFTPHVRAGRGYRYSPEMLYLGNIRLPGDERSIDIPIGAIEREREYSYVITFTVPEREAGPMRAMSAELIYDIPSLDIKEGSSQQSVVLDYTDDPQEAARINGEVERAFDEVEIGRMVDELEKAMSTDDHKKAGMFFDVIAKRYQELGDEEGAQRYRQQKQEYAASGGLSQEALNYNRHRATQKKESGVQLVDASDLI